MRVSKSGMSSPPDGACNHASFAREPTHPTLTRGSGPAAGAWRGAPTPSRPSGERGGLDGVAGGCPSSAPMVFAPQAGRREVCRCKRPTSHDSSPLCFLRLRLVALPARGPALPRPRRLDGSFAGRQESDEAARPCTACSRSHGALTHGVRAAQRVALPSRLRPLLLRPRLVPTHRRFVARPSRFRSRKGHWATARACTGEVRGQLLPLARSRPGKLVDACLASTSGVMCSVREACSSV